MLVAGPVGGFPLPGAAEGLMTVSLDRAKVFKYPANTETIIVGNPIIADVTMLKNSGRLVLTGKGFGETNLVFLDHDGTVLSESRLRVEPSGRAGDRAARLASASPMRAIRAASRP